MSEFQLGNSGLSAVTDQYSNFYSACVYPIPSQEQLNRSIERATTIWYIAIEFVVLWARMVLDIHSGNIVTFWKDWV
ncbi:DEHA2D03542p [Debaryomyces hansenii CBS767]|jgi:hypothetical protein|uniref:DEHA2D03542p n=1 Tax=Debaryomyces hansenii (strain ATCC 36239 / CBS 767 / BCRC 21394 / JCM 1990 / NBRC 0083 / IGC 2968) TaxID=284592 RepID=Q6BT48_DEBHA|nr:DEHA2D03542p [Debaryomyces hansenii CBS767]CAG86758.1 DEHA2D03542p [Debaryomyces hansenii CBS767]|eukprot:XP_458622.1 DEHA2D03542p [Debaryomyces hansenii CBS767]